jgi:hypothetical protein
MILRYIKIISIKIIRYLGASYVKEEYCTEEQINYISKYKSYENKRKNI